MYGDFLSPELVRGLPYGAASDAWAVHTPPPSG